MLFVCVSVIAPTAANEANWMPDANLRTAVRSALSIADDAALTQQDMQDLTSFSAVNSQISNITGLEHATALTSLDIRDNTVTDVNPLSALTDLEELRLKGNTLSDMSPLSGLTNLTLLNLRLTGISSVSALSGLTHLEHLRVDDNSITDVEPLTSLTNLRRLWIAGNALTNAHLLLNLTNLRTLDIRIPAPPDTTAPEVRISVPTVPQNGAFDVIITFTETVSEFVQEDVSLGGTATADITAWNTIDSIVYTATITPTTSGTVILDVGADVAIDTASNGNTAATTQTVTVDLDAPTVVISVPSGTQADVFDVTITFNESVSGFSLLALEISGDTNASITSWSSNADNTVFTAEITPTTSGTLTFNMAAGVTTDAANNPNTAATPQTVTITIADPQEPIVDQEDGNDTLAPDVNISVPTVPQNGAFDVIITFTEAVSEFVPADLLLGGTATADITAWNGMDTTVFTAEITPTTSGELTLDIDADVATDAASNGNTAAPQQTVVVDIDAPSVTLTLLPEVEGNRIDVQIIFSEPVVDFESADVLVTTNGLTEIAPRPGNPVTNFPAFPPPPIASITGWAHGSDGTTYTVYITTYTQTDGQVIINVPADVAMDSVGNSNRASNELSVDENPESYGFSYFKDSDGNWVRGDQHRFSGTCHTHPYFDSAHAHFDVNEDGSVDEADIALVEAALGQSGDGIINARTDINCDGTVDDTDFALMNDTTPPTVSVLVPTIPQSNAPFEITIQFSKVVTDLDVSDISLEGSTATATVEQNGWDVDSDNLPFETFKITPETSGELVISVPAGVVEDVFGGLNTASTEHTVEIDFGVPNVSSLTSTTPRAGVFTITITFSEEVSDFVQEDLELSGTANASVTAWESTDNTVFTATVTATSNGEVYYYVPGGVATDADDNLNAASHRDGYYKIELDSPTVTVSVPTDAQTGAFDVTIRFNESIADFEQTDVSLADSTADATITDFRLVTQLEYWLRGTGVIIAHDSMFEATITPTTSGTVAISIPADVCTDKAGNPNTASDTHTVTIELPGVGNAPSAVLSRITNLLDTTPLASLDLAQLEEQLQTLRVQSDGSAEYLQAIALLERTLAALRPEKTLLLANYPNPFNPETWIPYQLAAPSNVSITIYDARGTMVRHLDLGHQREGYYTSRSRAAYWDGRNDFGERVASGIYFYQLQADNMSLLRKMLILK